MIVNESFTKTESPDSPNSQLRAFRSFEGCEWCEAGSFNLPILNLRNLNWASFQWLFDMWSPKRLAGSYVINVTISRFSSILSACSVDIHWVDSTPWTDAAINFFALQNLFFNRSKISASYKILFTQRHRWIDAMKFMGDESLHSFFVNFGSGSSKIEWLIIFVDSLHRWLDVFNKIIFLNDFINCVTHKVIVTSLNFWNPMWTSLIDGPLGLLPFRHRLRQVYHSYNVPHRRFHKNGNLQPLFLWLLVFRIDVV